MGKLPVKIYIQSEKQKAYFGNFVGHWISGMPCDLIRTFVEHPIVNEEF
jgi:hypothetical protein